MRPHKVGTAWCNQHERYEVVYTDSYLPGTTIPHDPHTPASDDYRRQTGNRLEVIRASRKR